VLIICLKRFQYIIKIWTIKCVGAYYSLDILGKKSLALGMVTFNVFQKDNCVNCKIKVLNWNGKTCLEHSPQV
jgi:hypothetical protein